MATRRVRIDEEVRSCSKCPYLKFEQDYPCKPTYACEHPTKKRKKINYEGEPSYGKLISRGGDPSAVRANIPDWCPLPIVGRQVLKGKKKITEIDSAKMVIRRYKESLGICDDCREQNNITKDGCSACCQATIDSERK